MNNNIKYRYIDGAFVDPCEKEIYIRGLDGTMYKLKHQDLYYTGQQWKEILCCNCVGGTLQATSGESSGSTVDKTFIEGCSNTGVYYYLGRESEDSNINSTVYKVDSDTNAVIAAVKYDGLNLKDIVIDNDRLRVVGLTTPSTSGSTALNNNSIFLSLDTVTLQPVVNECWVLNNENNKGREALINIYKQDNTVGVDDFYFVLRGFIFDRGTPSTGLQDEAAVYYFNHITGNSYNRAYSYDTDNDQSDVEISDIEVGQTKHILSGGTFKYQNKALLFTVNRDTLAGERFYHFRSTDFGGTVRGRDILHIKDEEYLVLVDDISNNRIHFVIVELQNINDSGTPTNLIINSSSYISSVPTTLRYIEKLSCNKFLFAYTSTGGKELLIRFKLNLANLPVVEESVSLLLEGDTAIGNPRISVSENTVYYVAGRSNPKYPNDYNSFIYKNKFNALDFSDARCSEDVIINFTQGVLPTVITSEGGQDLSTEVYDTQDFVTNILPLNPNSEVITTEELSKCDYI